MIEQIIIKILTEVGQKFITPYLSEKLPNEVKVFMTVFFISMYVMLMLFF